MVHSIPAVLTDEAGGRWRLWEVHMGDVSLMRQDLTQSAWNEGLSAIYLEADLDKIIGETCEV